MKKIIYYFLFILFLFLNQLKAQGITLIYSPYRPVALNSSLGIIWEENIQATMHYGKSPGVHNLKLSIVT